MSWCRLRGRSTTTDGYIGWCFWKTARATKLHRIQRTKCCWMQKRFKPFQKQEAHQSLNPRQYLDLEMFKGTRGGLWLRQALDMWHPPLQTLSVPFMIASARTTGDQFSVHILCCRHSRILKGVAATAESIACYVCKNSLAHEWGSWGRIAMSTSNRSVIDFEMRFHLCQLSLRSQQQRSFTDL